MAAAFIPTGPYRFFTLDMLEVEKARYITARQQAGTRIAGTTVNGQTFTFGDRKDGSLEEWGENLQTALAYLAPDTYEPGPGDRAVGRATRHPFFRPGQSSQCQA